MLLYIIETKTNTTYPLHSVVSARLDLAFRTYHRQQFLAQASRADVARATVEVEQRLLVGCVQIAVPQLIGQPDVPQANAALASPLAILDELTFLVPSNLAHCRSKGET